MFGDPGRNLFIIGVIVVLGWFAVGTQLNIRRGNSVLRWLQEGLTLLGGKTTLRWLGSSAVELKLPHPTEPLRTAEIFIVLEPRDIPFLWWFFRARGRRDLLIVRGELSARPRFELEALDTRAWSTRGIERTVQSKQWTRLPAPLDAPLVAYTRGGAEAAPALLELATLPEMPLVRLAVRRVAPNLEVHWNIAGYGKLPARRVFEALLRIIKHL